MKTHRLQPYNRKIIASGNVLEVYEYEKPIVKGNDKSKRRGRANAPFTSADTKDENRKKTAIRARQTVRRMVNANSDILTKFLTLTFAKNMKDIKFARNELKKFIKRLSYKYEKFEYVEVIEFQKRGAIHFHLLCSLPYVDVNEVARIWGNGFVKLNRIDNIDNLGAYVTKYMTKNNIDERLIGEKCYTMSKGLKKPNETTDDRKIDEVLETLPDVKRTFTTEFESEYFGKVRYTQIILSEPLRIRKRQTPFIPRLASPEQLSLFNGTPARGMG